MTTPTQTARVRSRLAALMELRGIASLSELKEKSGLSYPTLMGLFHDRSTQVTFGVIATLCSVLECQPGDLLALDGQTWNDATGPDPERIQDLVSALADEVGIPGRIARKRRKVEAAGSVVTE